MMEVYLKKIIERIRPDTSGYLRFPIRGRVVRVQADSYTCDVQPLDEVLPGIPGVQILTVWASPVSRLLALPKEGSVVLIGFEQGDSTRPFIQGFISDSGFSGQFLLEGEHARIHFDEAGTITITSEKQVRIQAPEILLGAEATEALVKGNTYQSLFNAHTHGTGVGPSTPPVQPLNGSELSKGVTCV